MSIEEAWELLLTTTRLLVDSKTKIILYFQVVQIQVAILKPVLENRIF